MREQLVSEIVKSLADSPTQWVWGYNRWSIVNKMARIELNIHLVNVSLPKKIEFGFWHKRRLKKAFDKWCQQVGNELAVRDDNTAIEAALSRLRPTKLRLVA